MIRTLMADSFAQWLNAAIATSLDPQTNDAWTNARIGEVMGLTGEKVRSWRDGRRTPSAVEDVAAIAHFLRRTQAEVLEAIGYEVGADGLDDDERRLLAAFRRLRSVPILQQGALASLEGMPAALGPRTPGQSRGRQRSA